MRKNLFSFLVVNFMLLGLSSILFAEDGVKDNEIIFGRSTNITGASPSSFEERGWGYNAYFEKINKAGGVNGRKIKIIELDDAYEPGKSVENTKKFIEELKVFALFGYAGTPTMSAVVPYLNNHKNIPFVALNAATILREPFLKYAFMIRAGYQSELNAIVAHAVDVKKFKKIALFFQDDAYGKEGENGLNRELPKRNLKIHVSASYNRKEKDIKAMFDKIMAAKPDAIVAFSQAKQTAEFVNFAEQAKIKIPIYSTSNQATDSFLKETTEQGRENVIVATSMPEVDELTIKLVKDFNDDMAVTGKAVGGSSFEGYVGAMITIEGLKRMGKVITRDRFISSLEGMGGFDLGGLKVGISKTNHEVLSTVYLFRFRNGKPEKI